MMREHYRLPSTPGIHPRRRVSVSRTASHLPRSLRRRRLRPPRVEEEVPPAVFTSSSVAGSTLWSLVSAAPRAGCARTRCNAPRRRPTRGAPPRRRRSALISVSRIPPTVPPRRSSSPSPSPPPLSPVPRRVPRRPPWRRRRRPRARPSSSRVLGAHVRRRRLCSPPSPPPPPPSPPPPPPPPPPSPPLPCPWARATRPRRPQSPCTAPDSTPSSGSRRAR